MEEIKIEDIVDVVREAATLMDRSGGFEIRNKTVLEDLVTSSDVAIQHFLTEKLGTLLPGSGFLCEEEDLQDLNHRYIWIIDPIDGTANYARGNENCCISVGLVKDKELYMGVVYSPWRGELYTAVRGKGAYCNGKQIHVSDRPFENGLLYTAMSTYHKEWSRYCSDVIFDLYNQSNDVRRTGSAAVELCLLASGYADLYFEIRIMPWDYAAASLILIEAGGTACSFDGNFPSLFKPSMYIAANSRENCERILQTVRKHIRQLPYQPQRIACIGDSITWGFTLLNPWKQSYPALLQQRLGPGYEVRNFGYNDAAARFDADTPYVNKKVYRDSLAWNPDVVLIMLGTNDTKKRNWDPVIFDRDYRKIVESYVNLPSKPRVVLIAPIRVHYIMNIPLMGLYPETMEQGVRPTIHKIASELGLEIIDLKDLFPDTKYCRDGVHPQREGARMLEEAIYRGLFPEEDPQK